MVLGDLILISVVQQMLIKAKLLLGCEDKFLLTKFICLLMHMSFRCGRPNYGPSSTTVSHYIWALFLGPGSCICRRPGAGAAGGGHPDTRRGCRGGNNDVADIVVDLSHLVDLTKPFGFFFLHALMPRSFGFRSITRRSRAEAAAVAELQGARGTLLLVRTEDDPKRRLMRCLGTPSSPCWFWIFLEHLMCGV